MEDEAGEQESFIHNGLERADFCELKQVVSGVTPAKYLEVDSN